mgnify:CR=1 FL=1
MIIEFKGMRPDVEKAAFVADSATLAGDIHLGENSSVWFGASMRAEVSSITIGKDSNVQDNAMLHADYDLPIVIGERVSVGHNAIVHGATQRCMWMMRSNMRTTPRSSADRRNLQFNI